MLILLASGMSCIVVCQEVTDVSEECFSCTVGVAELRLYVAISKRYFKKSEEIIKQM
jgi:hypothetical protein